MTAMTARKWLQAYGESHRHPTNKLIHWICVPVITVTLVTLLSLIPFPPQRSLWLNVGTLFLLAAIVFYARLSLALAGGMVLVALATVGGMYVLYSLPGPAWQAAAGLFFWAWVGQFIGHKIEGKKPSFFEDVQFLLIGPMWLLAHIYDRLGIEY